MKKILNFFGILILIKINIISLISCNNNLEYKKTELKKLKEKNILNINNNIFEWITSQEKPFNIIDNKYYFVIWKGKTQWYITKFLNNEKLSKNNNIKILDEKYDGYKLKLHCYSFLNYEVDLNIYEPSNYTNWPWRKDKKNFFKSVYRLNTKKDFSLFKINKNTGKIDLKY